MLLELGITQKQISKGTDITDVVKKLNGKVYAGEVALGLIDEDPNSSRPSDFSNYQIIKEINNLIWMQKPNTRHVLIVICPRLEEWLYATAKTAKVNPSAQPYMLPKSASELHDEFTGKREVANNRGVMAFLTAVVDANPPQLQTLRNWLKEIQAL